MGLKLNGKMKKRIRKAVAGVCLVSSVLVAAIPADYSGVAQADEIIDKNESMNYAYDRDHRERNGKLEPLNSSAVDLSPSGDVLESYDIRYIDGQWRLLWKYRYFMRDIDGNKNVGVICGYNDTYKRSTLSLSSNIITEYQIISSEDFKTAETAINNMTFTLDVSPYEPGRDGTTVNDVQTYFQDDYDAWEATYKTHLDAWKLENPTITPTYNNPSLSDLEMSPLVCLGSKLNPEDKYRYYCDQHNMPEYTLVPVTDYVDVNSLGWVTTSSNTVYVFKLRDNVNNGTVAETDEEGFKYIDYKGVIAIGDRGFADAQKVEEMVVGDGIAYIGDAAFDNSYIQNVEFASVAYIGNEVFKDCQYLTNVTLSSKTSIIGREAFYNCKVLPYINIPEGVSQIGFGAFANCPVLTEVNMSDNHGVNIGEYAFYNCPQLSKVTFASNYPTSIGKAAFAMESGIDSSMTEFTFPREITKYVSGADGRSEYQLFNENEKPYSSPLGDYILAGRKGLETVIMPENFGSGTEQRVPMNTFNGCLGLESVRFSQNNNREATFDSNLFASVMNPEFYVYGPEKTLRNDYAMPRTATWEAKTGVSEYVPYVYTADGSDHYEVGIAPYRYELKVNVDENGNEDGTATIVSCRFIDTSDPQIIKELIVPGIVAKYQITDLGDGCFNGTTENNGVKNYIESLVIVDNSVQNIGDNVFEGCNHLKNVSLGNSVQTIGASAFADNAQLESVIIGEGIVSVGDNAFGECPQLEHVTWKRPYSYGTLTDIADNAFYTTSDKLYFEGEIKEGYVPFEYAMNSSSHRINSDSVSICYESPAPNKLYVIRDEMTGENLLIDYPHYYDLPAETIIKHQNNLGLNDDERALLNATMYLTFPEEITSIDVKSFLENSSNNLNQKNWRYIDDSDTWMGSVSLNSVSGNAYNRRGIYSNDNLQMPTGEYMSEYYAKTGGYHPGLFSGYYHDDLALMAYGDENYSKYDSKGNDWILSVAMPGVTTIPDYAFDSCERLQSVVISDACREIGDAAFQNCTALNAIGTGGSTKYIFDNYLLYEALDDGTYELNICLPRRGMEGGQTEFLVNAANDPLLESVSRLGGHVFTNCQGISEVDLSKTSIVDLPDETFKGCSKLGVVVLPDTIRSIGKKAFEKNAASLSVTIPHDCMISDDAFDNINSRITLWIQRNCEMIIGKYGDPDHNKLNNIYTRFPGEVFTITYYNDDGTVFASFEVDKGKDGSYPRTNPVPLLPSQQGYEFDGWLFRDGVDTIYEVTENRSAVAIFKNPVTSQTYTITYYNDDMTVYQTIEVMGGYNGFYPETDPTPKLAMHSGYLFSGWNFDHPDRISNVREDRMAVATFSLNGSNTISANQPGNGSGGNGNNGNNGSDGNNGSNGNSGSASGNSASGNSASSNAANNSGKYNVIVENGAGGGYYAPGSVVTITAYAAPTGKVFDRWTTSNTDIGFSNAFGASTTFIMPTHEVKVTATYKTPSVSSNRVSQNSTTNGTTNNNNTSGSGTTNRNPNKGGTDVTVTTTAIDNNNKNLASATVAGSTDNFVVKITDSAAASAAVEQALRAQYGDLSNIRFVGFDISLYDETGTRKIENTAGLAVTITIPIPDELVPYAGNNMAAGVVNGVLDPMAVKFTTIDGVPCMQFTATHFSPYAIYVNTNNLVSGVTDTTPKTGDIHPKWFLAIGLAGISGVLFTWRDKRKVPV